MAVFSGLTLFFMLFATFFIRKRVASRFQLDTQRSAPEFQPGDKKVDQVAPVGLWQVLCLLTMDHDYGRIAPPLVCIAQLDTSTMVQGRVVFEYGFFKQVGQVTRIEILERRGISLVYRNHQFAYPGAVAGGNKMLLGKWYKGQPSFQGTAILVTLL